MLFRSMNPQPWRRAHSKPSLAGTSRSDARSTLFPATILIGRCVGKGTGGGFSVAVVPLLDLPTPVPLLDLDLDGVAARLGLGVRSFRPFVRALILAAASARSSRHSASTPTMDSNHSSWSSDSRDVIS